MQAFWFLLQFLIPLGAVLWLVWKFLLVPAIQRTQERIAREEREQQVRQRIQDAFPEEGAPAATDEDEIQRAISELKSKENK